MSKRCVNHSLDEKTIEKLKRYSEESMVAKSKVVDRAINEYIDRQDKQPKGRNV